MELLTYRTDAGRVPFGDWYRGLDRVAKARVITAMDRPETGNLSSTKGVGSGVFEFRIDFGPGYRYTSGRTAKSSSCFWPVAVNGDTSEISMRR